LLKRERERVDRLRIRPINLVLAIPSTMVNMATKEEVSINNPDETLKRDARSAVKSDNGFKQEEGVMAAEEEEDVPPAEEAEVPEVLMVKRVVVEKVVVTPELLLDEDEQRQEEEEGAGSVVVPEGEEEDIVLLPEEVVVVLETAVVAEAIAAIVDPEVLLHAGGGDDAAAAAASAHVRGGDEALQERKVSTWISFAPIPEPSTSETEEVLSSFLQAPKYSRLNLLFLLQCFLDERDCTCIPGNSKSCEYNLCEVFVREFYEMGFLAGQRERGGERRRGMPFLCVHEGRTMWKDLLRVGEMCGRS